MPGIWLTAIQGDPREDLAARIARAREAMLHGEGFRAETLVAGPSLHLGFTAHAAYPLRHWETADTLVVLEGIVYGRDESAVASELEALCLGAAPGEAPASGASAADLTSRITDWVRGQDGDFVICLLDKQSGRFALFNDLLGRLPLYAAELPEGLAIAREVKFAAALLKERALDPLGGAEHLVFGYPLGQRTLVRGVHRLPPATVVCGDARTGAVEILRTVEARFDAAGISGQPVTTARIREHGAALAFLFREACARRFPAPPGATAVLSLSGGLDSRSVAAGLTRAGIPFKAATFDAEGVIHPQDVAVARELAEILGVEWKLFSLGADTITAAEGLLRLKDGLNYTGMSFLLPFYEALREAWGNDLALWTGDGGDKLLPPLLPEGTRLTDKNFLTTLVARHAIFSPSEAERITGLERGTLVSTLREHVAAYPERDPESRNAGFFVRERAYKWLFEGEDRTRFFFWGTSPFWSPPLAEAAFAIPQSARDGHALYAAFLQALDPRLAEVRNARWGSAIAKRPGLFLIARGIMNRLPEALRFRLKTALRSRQARIPAQRRAWLAESLAPVAGGERVISAHEAEMGLRRGSSRVRFEMLLTVAAYERSLMT
jgi:asparagine synthase (glutamine-hydrolysing)